ncbi:FxsA family protein [Thalassotalea eurytherma]|uniref:Membrane protein FxsA n=1 Tax=Thalassotalea eurytherma TaxID=1144278 RepID=A0ABQ6H3Y8_9GAMM|nr:FxsA family protein [Thalassotalea eurytherma]GLX82886.1 membrane protein FxsA [Thalassotalea eurytherma]
MFPILFLMFVLIPIIEITVLIQVGTVIGTWPTVAIVVLTAWLGAKFVRQQGLTTLRNLQEKSARGEIPSNEIITGFLLLLSGVFLVTPGFVTDAFGLSLLIPSVRNGFIKKVQSHIHLQAAAQSGFHSAHFQQGNTYEHEPFDQQPFDQAPQQPRQHLGDTIEGEYERKE